MNKALIAILLYILLSVSYTYSSTEALIEKYFPGLTAEEKAAFAETGKLIKDAYVNPESFIPKTSFRNRILYDHKNLNPNAGIETIYIIPREKLGNIPKTDLRKERLRAYNILHRVSAFKGLNYYSRSRNEYRILFIESYAVNNIESRTKIKDPVFKSLPANNQMFVYQEDRTFGKNFYKCTTIADEQSFFFVLENASNISYKLFPLAKPGKLQFTVQVIIEENAIIIYGGAKVNTVSFFGLEKTKQSSFRNRIEALIKHFIETFAAELQAENQ